MKRRFLLITLVSIGQLLLCTVFALAQTQLAQTQLAQTQEEQIHSVVKNNVGLIVHGDPKKGRELLLNKHYLPRDFHQSVVDELWRDWPEPLRSAAEKADKKTRRQMTFSRYGWTSREDNPELPKQYAVDEEGWYAMNCFACHGGQVGGKSYDGLPNSRLALETLYDDMRKTKIRMKVPLSGMDVGSVAIPMGTSNGTSNAVMFGVALMGFRNPDLSHKLIPLRPKMTHHDMDSPAWWNVKYRDRIYIDGFVEKNLRALIPFVLDARTDGETIKSWEEEFKHIYAFIHSLEAPKYPYEVDARLADRGKVVFENNCSQCHGTYGKNPKYPGVIVDIDDIGTDRVRLDGFSVQDRKVYRDSWFTDFGKDETNIDPDGYLAPPLNGVWASAPYFHNGSVPTLWHVLNPEQRPVVWKRHESKYDREKAGLVVESFEYVPDTAVRKDQKREYFDSRKAGKSREGHDYPSSLTEAQKKALLEYLKTL